ncbi:MAG TPA: enoyl-ACP reductase [Aquificales bacterium]|uniref:Enoyl-[acyl-carrier-protein] reductase [NADH] n=1 Tax=Aquifex aeolicus TaxID=63363 RepID=A0A9D1CF04_AQUAO|nr:enoyl-ACP reductase [Aquificales bacterium]HIP97886.1 enoyl-ACP reductase [Aquifex aeolicus]
MGLLNGKIALVTGIANKNSIAYGIAQAFKREGAKLILTYANEKIGKKIDPIAKELEALDCLEMDVSSDTAIDKTFERIAQITDRIDIVVHSIAFAPAEEFKRPTLYTSREGFKIAMDISVYSLIALTQRAIKLMEGTSGAFLTLSYYGAEKVVPRYNVMGIAKAALESTVRYLAYDLGKKGHRINAISAGPVKTLAARAISGFHLLMKHTMEVSPLGRGIDILDVGNAAVFLCSDWAKNITGEVLHVDAGYHVMGVMDKEDSR